MMLREVYLQKLAICELDAGRILDPAETEELEQACMAFNAEKAARKSLMQREQSRSMIAKKLAAQGHQTEPLQKALDYLEAERIISDARFAQAWLRNRLSSRQEGKHKLYAELLARGVGRRDAETAVNTLFSDESEEQLCIKAIIKYENQEKSHADIAAKLYRKGFSYKLITSCLKARSDRPDMGILEQTTGSEHISLDILNQYLS